MIRSNPPRRTKKPPRFRQDFATYFLTFCTFGRNRLLHDRGVPELLVRSLHFYSSRIRELIAYTIMPDHIHLMVDVETVSSLSAFLRDFKKFTSKEIRRMTVVNDPYIWQRGTYDHCIRHSQENRDLSNHVQYVYFNSWKHLGIRPRDFQWHNFQEIVARGWLDLDFCNFPDGAKQEFKRYE